MAISTHDETICFYTFDNFIEVPKASRYQLLADFITVLKMQ